MIHIAKEQLEQTLSWDLLISGIRSVFSKKADVPQRHHHQYPTPGSSIDSTLLLMPAWDAQKYLGVKIVSVSPENGKKGLPSVQGTYMLFNLTNGTPLATMDAKTLTIKRTAATSALVSSMLSRKDSAVLLMIGTGALAPELIRAHCSVRPIKKVLIWGRNRDNTQKLVDSLKIQAEIVMVPTIAEGLSEADIISCATLSTEPLVLGADIKAGQHIDLVGSFKPDMREGDDALMRKSSIYVDTVEGATQETGDIMQPIKAGIFNQKDIKGDLFSLCQTPGYHRTSKSEITCFKSVGHALEDLAAAGLAYESILSQEEG